MKSFREEMGLKPDPQDRELTEEYDRQLGLFKSNDERLDVYRMLQQRLYERKQRSLAKQEQAREE